MMDSLTGDLVFVNNMMDLLTGDLVFVNNMMDLLTRDLVVWLLLHSVKQHFLHGNFYYLYCTHMYSKLTAFTTFCNIVCINMFICCLFFMVLYFILLLIRYIILNQCVWTIPYDTLEKSTRACEHARKVNLLDPMSYSYMLWTHT